MPRTRRGILVALGLWAAACGESATSALSEGGAEGQDASVEDVVAVGTDADDAGSTSEGGAPKDAGPPFVVAVVGDYGVCGSTDPTGVGSAATCPDERAVAALVHGWMPDRVLTVGDNSYGAGTTAQIPGDQAPYLDEIDAGIFFPALGNHDYISCNFDAGQSVQVGPTMQFFGMARRYYEVPLGPFATAFLLDTNPQDPDGVSAAGVQAQWLADQLGRSTTPWNFVVNHQAPYSSCGEGSYTDAGNYAEGGPALGGAPQCGVVPDVRWIAHDKVDVVFSGHSHLYERLIEPGANGAPKPFVVMGASGAGLQGNCGKRLPGQQFAAYGVFGALKLTIREHAFTAEFYAADGGALDRLSLLK